MKLVRPSNEAPTLIELWCEIGLTRLLKPQRYSSISHLFVVGLLGCGGYETIWECPAAGKLFGLMSIEPKGFFVKTVYVDLGLDVLVPFPT